MNTFYHCILSVQNVSFPKESFVPQVATNSTRIKHTDRKHQQLFRKGFIWCLAFCWNPLVAYTCIFSFNAMPILKGTLIIRYHSFTDKVVEAQKDQVHSLPKGSLLVWGRARIRTQKDCDLIISPCCLTGLAMQPPQLSDTTL